MSSFDIRFESMQSIAKGGYSTVYRAETVEGKRVAVKVFEPTHDGDVLFENEASLMDLLPEHPLLPKHYGSGRYNGSHFIALEYFPFGSLASFLKDQGALPEESALHIARQIVEALTVLTEAGVAHRDIKPDNILIDPVTLRIKLIDFGLGSLVDDESTRDDFYVGTPIYMAPQILASKPYRVVSADLFSTGLTVLEVLLGFNPLENKAKTPKELLKLQAHLINTSLRRFKTSTQKVLQGFLSSGEFDRFDLTEARKELRKINIKPRAVLKSSQFNNLHPRRARSLGELRPHAQAVLVRD